MRTLANLLLLLTSLATGLGIGELAVRWLGLAPEVVYIEKWRVRLSDNPRIGYEPIPHLDSRGKSVQFYGYDGRSNAMGYRDRDHPLDKPVDRRRVLVLGDSVTAGLWVNDDEAVYTSVMERALAADGIAADVMNFGVSGYNTAQEVETLRVKGLAYSPDTVVLAYCLNDRQQDDGGIYGLLLDEAQKVTGSSALTRLRTHPVVQHSALLRMISYKVLPTLMPATAAPEAIGRAVGELYADTVAAAFADLARLRAEHGFDVTVAIFPDFGAQDRGLDEPYAYAAEHATIAALADTHGFDVLDLLHTFRACRDDAPPSQTISFDRYHPNPLGNLCAGEALAAHLAGRWRAGSEQGVDEGRDGGPLGNNDQHSEQQ
jgi:lysophospholipase L1-like esterase